MVQKQFQTEIEVSKIDNTKKYFEMVLGDYLENGGNHSPKLMHWHPQQNGIAERKKRHH